MEKIKALRHFSKNEIIREIKTLKTKGWLELSHNRYGKDGGLGNSLEDYLEIAENNLAIADLGSYELKTHRAASNSLISIFRQEPGPPRSAIVPYLINTYGWGISRCPTKIRHNKCPHDFEGTRSRCYPDTEKSLRIDMDGKSFSERGFIIKVNRDLQRIEIHFNSKKVHNNHIAWLELIQKNVHLRDLDEKCHWTFDAIRKKISSKLKNMVYVTFDTKTENNREYKKIVSAQFFENLNFEKFLNAIEIGYVQVEFNARTHHNHGTAFRTWERYWSYFYDIREPVV